MIGRLAVQQQLIALAVYCSVSLITIVCPVPAFASSPVARAEHEYVLGNYDKVLSILKGNRDLPALILQGRAQRWKDSFTEAFFNDALRLFPLESTALTWRGFCSLDRRRYSEADPWLRKALQANPKNADALAMLGYCQLKKGNTGDGLALLRQALRISPGRELELEYMALAAESLLDWKGAEKYYNQIIESFPGMPRAWDIKGEFYERSGKFKEAKESYGKALEINPRFEAASTHLANLQLNQKLYAEMVATSTRCINFHSLSEEYYKCLRLRARGYEALQQLKLAVTDWEVYLGKYQTKAAGALSHSQDEAFLAIARDQRRLKNYDQALDAITRLLKVRPTSRDGRFEEGQILEKMSTKDGKDKAAAIYTQLISEDNTVVEWYRARAGVLRQLGRFAAAADDEKMVKSMEE